MFCGQWNRYVFKESASLHSAQDMNTLMITSESKGYRKLGDKKWGLAINNQPLPEQRLPLVSVSTEPP
jgi:hypothetical protein